MYNYPNASSTQNVFASVLPSALPMKRSISDVEPSSSDCDDVFSPSKALSDKGSAPMPSGNDGDSSCQLVNRKRRRGFIEKKRRDRINNSLQELKRLVPAAFEKQGAHKLEKAEILQLTVDHLRNLQAKGFDAFTFDPQKYALDYHSLGFRECASEVARYLVAVEGVDLQDPLRLRLMSHLQCYATQRELALKSASAHSPWNPSVFTAPPQFSSSHITSQSHNTSSASVSTSDVSNHYNNSHLSASLSDCSSILSTSTHMMPPPPPPPHVLLPKQTNSPPPSASYTSSAQQQVSNHQAHHSHQYFSPAYGTPGTHQANANGVKYCRPWGGELAY